MNSILVLVKKDFAIVRHNRTVLVISFVIPFMLIYLFGQIFGVNQKDHGPSGIPIGVVNQSTDPAAQTLVDALRAEPAFRVVATAKPDDAKSAPLREEDLNARIRANEFRFALVIPADVVRTDKIGLHLKIYSNPRNEIETQLVNGILEKTIFSNVPELLGASLEARARSFLGDPSLDRFDSDIADSVARAFGGDPAEIKRRMQDGHFGIGRAAWRPKDDGGAPAKMDDILDKVFRIDKVQVVGADVRSPQATLLVGGWAMQFLLFAVAGSAAGLFRERDQGLFQRLLSSGVRRSDILWSKFIYGICFGLVQLIVLFFAGHVMYGIEIGAQLPHLILVAVFAAAACTAFGMLIASVAKSPEAAQGLSTFIILLMSAIGGAWFPVSLMPVFMQQFSKLTLVYWAMEGFSQVLWSHATLGELLPTLGWLTLITGLVLAVAMWRFRRGRIFE